MLRLGYLILACVMLIASIIDFYNSRITQAGSALILALALLQQIVLEKIKDHNKNQLSRLECLIRACFLILISPICFIIDKILPFFCLFGATIFLALYMLRINISRNIDSIILAIVLVVASIIYFLTGQKEWAIVCLIIAIIQLIMLYFNKIRQKIL